MSSNLCLILQTHLRWQQVFIMHPSSCWAAGRSQWSPACEWAIHYVVSFGATSSLYLDFVGEVGGQGRSRARSDEELPRGHRELQYMRVIL